MKELSLLPLTYHTDKTDPLFADPECQNLFNHYPAYYDKIGFNPPWIGYCILLDGTIVGCCGFVSKPINDSVEIAYGTFKEFEGKGVASFACRELVKIAQQADKNLTITAKTLMEENASVRLLKKFCFEYRGIVVDDDESDVWEWVYKPKS